MKLTNIKEYTIIFAVVFSTIIFLFLLWEAGQEGTTVKEEIIPPKLTQVHCLSWDEAKAKYNISGMVLLEKMVEKCPT